MHCSFFFLQLPPEPVPRLQTPDGTYPYDEDAAKERERRHHADYSPEPLVCPVCHKAFHWKGYFATHLRKIHGRGEAKGAGPPVRGGCLAPLGKARQV